MRVGVVGSREFKNWDQLKATLDKHVGPLDEIVSGGARGVDSMAQRYAKESGLLMHIYYPKEQRAHEFFARNKKIVENSDIILAFYQAGRFNKGGTANTAMWARKLGRHLIEYEEGIKEAVQDNYKEITDVARLFLDLTDEEADAFIKAIEE